jgi:hypothetical protein
MVATAKHSCAVRADTLRQGRLCSTRTILLSQNLGSDKKWSTDTVCDREGRTGAFKNGLPVWWDHEGSVYNGPCG